MIKKFFDNILHSYSIQKNLVLIFGYRLIQHFFALTSRSWSRITFRVKPNLKTTSQKLFGRDISLKNLIFNPCDVILSKKGGMNEDACR